MKIIALEFLCCSTIRWRSLLRARRLACTIAVIAFGLIMPVAPQPVALAAGAPVTETPWGTVFVALEHPGDLVYVSQTPVSSLAHLTPYRPAYSNLALNWDTSYRFDPETDSEAVRNDARKGWNVYPHLADGRYGDGDTDTWTSYAPGTKKIVTPEFDFGQRSLVSSVVVTTKASSMTGDAPVRVEVYSGDGAGTWTSVGAVDARVSSAAYSFPEVAFAPFTARFVKVRITAAVSGLDVGEVCINGVPNGARRIEVSGLVRGKSYWIAVASGPGATARSFHVFQIRVHSAFEDGSAWARYGVNVHLEHLMSQPALLERAVQMIAAAGIRWVRWYPCGGSDRVATLLAKYGIGAMMGPTSPVASLVGVFNEPELARKAPDFVAAQIAGMHASVHAAHPDLVVGGPACMGESTQYEAKVLSMLSPKQLDFYDFHPYVKSTTQPVDGLARNEPENVATIYRRNLAVLEASGMHAMPIVASETGYSTFEGSSWTKSVSRDEQAAYLTRLFLAQIALGVRGIAWYDFQDDGLARSNIEHNFGIVLNDLQPKPAYFAYQAMTRLVGSRPYLSGNSKPTSPDYCYTFGPCDDYKNTLTVFVNAVGRTSLDIPDPNRQARLYNLYGNPEKIRYAGKIASIDFAGEPVYLATFAPPRIIGVRHSEIPAPQRLTLTGAANGVTAFSRSSAGIDVTVASSYHRLMPIAVRANSSAFLGPATRSLNLAPGKSVKVHLDALLAPGVDGTYPVDLTVSSPEGSVQRASYLAVSPAPPGSPPTARLIQVGAPGRRMAVIESTGLYVVVSPDTGSRVLRIVDKTTGCDQLYVPPTIRGGLTSYTDNLEAGEWLSLGGYPGSVCKAVFDAVPLVTTNSAILDMTSVVDGCRIMHRVEISADSPKTLCETYFVANTTSQPIVISAQTHPEFTPGGSIDSGGVEIIVPSEGAVKRGSFLAYGGDLGTLPPDQGWWNAINTDNHAAIRCAFDSATVAGIRQWHDGSYFNMELGFRKSEIKPGESLSFHYAYTFGTTLDDVAPQGKGTDLK